jgi:arylsulfatase A-like enzyme
MSRRRHPAAGRIRAMRVLSNVLMAGAALLGAHGASAQAVQPNGFPIGPRAPADAPNILIVMTDDVGFGASSTFGGPIPTKTLDGLAAQGVRYNGFHTVSVCAATRAALLTGRNSHSVASGAVPEMATPFPGYNSAIPPSAATFARVLQLNGYSTAMFGKHHNTPIWEDNPAGPATHKPNGFGFDYFYGFIGAATDEFRPQLWENLTQVEPPQNDPHYILDHDLADHAIAWLRNQQTFAPGKPFLLYYAPGTLHAPVQAPDDWIRRFRGRFDQGWDVMRREIYERQKRLGVIPADADLAPMPPDTPKWDSLSPDQKKVAARYMEVYAAALAYCDDQVGRVVEELKRSGRYDNTLIIFIEGDNGASVEGGPDGAFSYNDHLNGLPESLAENLRRIDQIGGPLSMPAIPEGWTRATNAPFPWNKTIASHLGGTRNGLVISWPGHISASDRIRYQFHHVIDIAPTLYEAAGITPPVEVDGVKQQPIEGVSMLYTLRHPQAASPRHEQYFETFGNMGLYEDGLMLSSRPTTGGQSLYADGGGKTVWELYDLRQDFSQAHDLAAQDPGRTSALTRRFREVAAAHDLDPISGDMMGRMLAIVKMNPVGRPGRYTYHDGPTRYVSWAFPDVRGKSWSLQTELTSLADHGDGMIATQGGRFGGWGLLVLKGHATLLYRTTERDADLVRMVDPDPLAPGRHLIRLEFEVAQARMGAGGEFRLKVDGKTKARLSVARTVPFSFYEDAEIGRDYGSTLSDDYRGPFVYPGEIAYVDIDTGDAQSASAPVDQHTRDD